MSTQADQETPAYRLGQWIGAFNRSLREFAQHLNAGIAAGINGQPLERTAEQLERMAARAHRIRLEGERHQGLAFVHAEAARVRGELGLPPVRRGAR